MKHKIYQVDGSTAVCPLREWLADDLLQHIAMENNLAETAFYVRKGDQYQIRWFTPKAEVDLCGYATLAAAYVLFNHESHQGYVIKFYSSRSGELSVTKQNGFLMLNFPKDEDPAIQLSQRTGYLQCKFSEAKLFKPTIIFPGKLNRL